MHSLLLPGSGQMKTGSETLGRNLMIAFGISLGTVAVSQILEAHYVSDFNDQARSYSASSNPAEILGLRRAMEQSHENALTAYHVGYAGLVAGVLVYAFSAIDSYFIHNRECVIEELGPGGGGWGLQLPDKPNASPTISVRIGL